MDTSFIVSCIKERIDFFFELKKMGFKIIVPKEVFEELRDLRFSGNKSHEDKVAVNVALEILSSKKVKKRGFGGKKVDDALIKVGREGAYVATLDRGIKRSVPNRVVLLKARGAIGVERD